MPRPAGLILLLSAAGLLAAPAPSEVVREPAVAGLFYPADATALSRAIDGYLEAAKVQPVPRLRALVCPHAGYEYSGPIAAMGYKLLVGTDYTTVVLLAPSHYALLDSAAVSRADRFRTPLGDVVIDSAKARALAKLKPFALEAPLEVQRPSWMAQSSRRPPAAGEDTADTWEHSDEVQVPFLQRALKSFKLLPIVFGRVDPEAAARVLAQELDDRTLVVVSSDLSHYHPYAQASALDRRCVQAICALDIDQMRAQEACGKTPILTLMHLARLKGWKAKLLDYRNSGDTAGDKRGVVGYAAIAFHEESQGRYSSAEREQLLRLARATVREVVTRGQLPEVATNALSAAFLESKGTFVTLTKRGELRGCIGQLLAVEPLYRSVMSNARSAALRDSRFPPVQPEELPELKIEVSVLTEPQPLAFTSPEDLLSQLHPHEDGVILTLGRQAATFLPQVWEQLPDKTQFLSQLARKAGCEPSAWREPGTTVAIYHVEAFKESD